MCTGWHALPQHMGVAHSQPSAFAFAWLQSMNPGMHDMYMHTPPGHVAPTLRVVSQTFPQPPQCATSLAEVSHPSVSAPVFTQSMKPVMHV